MTFWQKIDAQLDRIEAEKPGKFDGVREILMDPKRRGLYGPDEAFFGGSGGDRSLLSALQRAGWLTSWAEAGYHYGAYHMTTGETLTYCEGDVLRGDAR